MQSIFTVFVGFLFIFSFGYMLSMVILPKAEKLELISLGYILGIGVFTLIWFILNWIGIPYNLLSGSIVLIVINVLVLFIYRIKFGKWFGKVSYDFSDFKKLALAEKIGLSVIAFICLSVFAQCLYWPVHVWDALVLYDFRAEVFVQTGFMDAAIARGYFFSYPLLTSLAHTWVYVLKGVSPNFVYALWYLAFLIIIFFNLKRLKLPRLYAIFMTLAVAISPRLFDHTQWSYTNLPYTIYLSLGYIYLYFGIKNKDLGSYIISAILIGLSNWTRTLDPFWITAILAAVVFPVFMKKWLWPLAYVSLVGLLMLPWRLFQSVHNQGVADLNPAPLAIHNVLQNLNLPFLKITFDFFIANVIHTNMIYFVLLAIIIVAKIIIKSKEWLFAALIILDVLLVYLGTIMLASNTVYWQDIPDSLARMVMFVPVLMIFLFAELLTELKKR